MQSDVLLVPLVLLAAGFNGGRRRRRRLLRLPRPRGGGGRGLRSQVWLQVELHLCRKKKEEEKKMTRKRRGKRGKLLLFDRWKVEEIVRGDARTEVE